MCGYPLQKPARHGNAPLPAAKNRSGGWKPTSHLPLFMEELGQTSPASLGLEVSFCEMGQRRFGFPRSGQGLTKSLEMVSIEPHPAPWRPEHPRALIEMKSLAEEGARRTLRGQAPCPGISGQQ